MSVKRLLWMVCLSVVLLMGMVPPAVALSPSDVPNPRRVNGGWVTDMADLISPETEATLNQMISALEADNGAEVAVVTVPETAPSPTPKTFATALFNRWKIGKINRDNGVLFLISLGDRRTEIETGRGLQTILPDARVQRILEREVVPQFKQKDFDQGILDGTRAVIAILRDGGAYNPILTPIREADWYVWSAIASGLGLGAIAVLRVLIRQRLPISLEPQDYQRFHNTIHNRTSDAVVRRWGWWGGFGIVLAIATGLWIIPADWLSVTFKQPRLALEIMFPGMAALLGASYLGKVLTGEWRGRPRIQPARCAACQQPMQHLKGRSLDDYLTDGEKTAQRIGSVHFNGWQCPPCSAELLKKHPHQKIQPRNQRGINIQALVLDWQRFFDCPTCHELTMTQTDSRVLTAATTKKAGQHLKVYHCECCQRTLEKRAAIPKLRQPSSSAHNSRQGSTSTYTDYGSSSSYDSGSSSSGSDFGGGGSDGGGGGASW